MNPTNIPATGGLASPIDARDWTLASVGAPTVYPESAFINTDWMKISMQSQIGCCVGCSFEEIVRKIGYTKTGIQEDLSWRFVYAMCKALEGTPGFEQFARTAGANDGTYPALAAQVIRKYGVPLASLCPNDASLSANDFCYGRNLANIPAAALADALTRRAGADMTVPLTEEGIKQAINYAIANNGGVAILRRVGNTYWTGPDGGVTWDKDKLLPIRVPSNITGGHEEMLYGYDKEPGTGRTRVYWVNHWSSGWCSTGGSGTDGGRAWEYLDVWLPLIGEVRVSVAALPAPVPTFKYTFTKILSMGMQGPDVVALQHILSLEGCFPPGQAFTGYFGEITFEGVVKLQEKYAAEILTPSKLPHGTGIVGNATRAWLNKHYG